MVSCIKIVIILKINQGGKNYGIKGSKTEANLWTAFAGESQAEISIHIMPAKPKRERL